MLDIQYLLLLQNFRNSTNNILTPFMEWISLFSVTNLILIPTFVYWIIDQEIGFYTLATACVCRAFNAVVKLTACIYRPWIKDPRVLPAGDSIKTATGYSFPSGHSVTAGSFYGGLAVGYRKRAPWVTVICVLALAVTAFSRNYLGVHTPQDVLVGLLEAVLSLLAVSRALRYLERHPEKENLFLIGMFVFGCLALVYITFKPYPMTYVDGKLLVDPQKMMNDGYGDIAYIIALPAARVIEKKLVRFRAPGLSFKGILTGIIGIVPMFLMIRYMRPALDLALGSHWGHFLNTVIIVLYSMALFPFYIRLVWGQREELGEE